MDIDLFGTLNKLMNNRQKIERFLQLIKLDWKLMQPEIDLLRQDAPELFELGRGLIAVFAPQAQQWLAGIAPLASISTRDLQQQLKFLGYYNGEADNKYGLGTTHAVEAFQRDNKLEVDGWAGIGETLPAIWVAVAEKKKKTS